MCDYCDRHGHGYDFNCPDCRRRWVATLPPHARAQAERDYVIEHGFRDLKPIATEVDTPRECGVQQPNKPDNVQASLF